MNENMEIIQKAVTKQSRMAYNLAIEMLIISLLILATGFSTFNIIIWIVLGFQVENIFLEKSFFYSSAIRKRINVLSIFYILITIAALR